MHVGNGTHAVTCYMREKERGNLPNRVGGSPRKLIPKRGRAMDGPDDWRRIFEAAAAAGWSAC